MWPKSIIRISYDDSIFIIFSTSLAFSLDNLSRVMLLKTQADFVSFQSHSKSNKRDMITRHIRLR